ncbi:MAG: cysteine desulfurase-like protein [Fimbriimonadaceae bacterium]|nr:cysteine desulfurase-like protein [Fimbriimonadaceae bacterium]
MLPSHRLVRARFPSLADGFAFLENAGGSQVPDCVIAGVARCLVESNVQVGAGYAHSDRVTQMLADAHRFVETLTNAGPDRVAVLGGSSSELFASLAHAVGKTLRPGDEIVVGVSNHEANAGPWVRLADRGVVVKLWPVDPRSGESRLTDLAPLLTDRTRVVAFAHTSNLLGDVQDVQAVTRMAHAVGARVVVDGVAHAPHRAIDVAAWGCDFYAFSAYKVFAPHVAAMVGRREAFAELEGPNHFFLPREAPYAFELGCRSFEGCAGLFALSEYLAFVAGHGEFTRASVEAAYARFDEWERPLQSRLVAWLANRPGVRLLGPAPGEDRVPTVSFVHERLRPSEIVAHVHRRPIGIRYGHMYAYRLCQALGVATDEGVVRVSAVHTNAPAEVERLIEALDEIL